MAQTYSGKFVLRTLPVLHAEAAQTAKKINQSLNSFIVSAVEEKIRREKNKSKK